MIQSADILPAAKALRHQLALAPTPKPFCIMLLFHRTSKCYGMLKRASCRSNLNMTTFMWVLKGNVMTKLGTSRKRRPPSDRPAAAGLCRVIDKSLLFWGTLQALHDDQTRLRSLYPSSLNWWDDA